VKKVVLLGAGLIGKTIAADLCKDYSVLAVDVDRKKLDRLKSLYPVETILSSVTDWERTSKFLSDADLIIGAVPGFLGFQTLKNIIQLKKDVVDISFFGEDPFELDSLAKQNKVTAVVDCGVAPGLSNIIIGYFNSKMKIDSFKCYVGGLPVEREWPFEYKAPFSPSDVIEEYTRPARIVENGNMVVKPALSEPELIEFKSIGKLEAFNTDGLRSLITTMKIPNMIEKTLRYPGHIEYMRVLREAGFFNKEPMEIGGQKIKPIDFTSKLLFPLWHLDENEPEFTVLRLIIEGNDKQKKKQIIFDLYDKYDERKNLSSMARTTGFTCTAAARLILNEKFNRKGICPPEFIGENEECYNKVLNDLRHRGIEMTFSEKEI
jgi:saccharopine dehydrogenase-like NADP-dependent oxidoreductase